MNIIRTNYDITEHSFGVENELITSIEIKILGHFGNCISLEILCENRTLYSGHNNTGNVGNIVRSLIILLKQGEENGITLSSIRNIPVRVLLDKSNSRPVGIAHFIKNNYILFEDFKLC